MPVREKGKVLVWSHFDVFLVRDGEDRGKPFFVREGIIISDIRSFLSRGVRSLVIVEDRPLAGMLGDSENPAHTQWQKDSRNYKNKYTYGEGNIRFVVNSVSEIIRLVNEGREEMDRSLLVDLFSLPARAAEQPGVRTRNQTPTHQEPGPGEPPPGEPPPPPPRMFRIDRTAGGFSVLPGSPEVAPPTGFEVKVAYDVRRALP